MFKKRGKWYITFRQVPDGKSVQRVSGADKKLAQTHQDRMRLEWQQYLATGVYRDPKMDLTMKEHVRDYLDEVGRGSMSDVRYTLIQSRLKLLLERSEKLTDLPTHLSKSTVDGYIQVLKQFGGWMVDHDRANKNPFAIMKRSFRKGRDETFIRRALTIDEVRRLAEASPGRAVLYYVAATTGLRAGELRSLTWTNVQLVGKSHIWAIVIEGKDTKNGKSAVIPLQPWVADMMIPTLPGIPLFESASISAAQIRRDAKGADIALEDTEGRVLDFHSLRASAATILLSLGVQADAVQQIMRHGSFQTTVDHYRKNDIDILAQQVVIPDPRKTA